jgi:hypothetical protein
MGVSSNVWGINRGFDEILLYAQNDKFNKEVQEKSPDGIIGVSPIPLNSPKTGGYRGLIQ